MTLKVQKYLPIKITEIRLLLSYYWGWYKTYDKDCYKYVIENLDLKNDLKNKYYDDIISSLHNLIKGGKFYKIALKEGKNDKFIFNRF
jgi:hypothetical protein